MELRLVLSKLYESFSQKFYQIDDLVNEKVKDRALIYDFLLVLHQRVNLHSVNTEYLFRYLVFQFDYWSNKKVENGLRITYTNIFGLKAQQRFFDRSKNYSQYNAEKNLKTNMGIDRELMRQFNNQSEKTEDSLKEAEEWFKSVFYDTPQGFRICLDNTTLFDHKSKLCSLCKFKRECKATLKKNYLTIYVDRGYYEASE